MWYRLRQRWRNDGGFTLIELVVVLLIIGVLAAIAIPSFLSQTSKANDTAAKTQVGTMQTTEQAWATVNGGSYLGGDLAKLREIEPTLKDTVTASAHEPVVATDEYEVSSVAKGSGDEYKLQNKKGTITRTCTPVSKGGCNAAGKW